MRHWTLLILPIAVLASSDGFGISLIVPEHSAELFNLHVNEAARAFSGKSMPITLVAQKQQYQSSTMCVKLEKTVQSALSKNPKSYIFILTERKRTQFCYRSWKTFYTPRVLFVTVNQENPEDLKKTFFWFMDGTLYRASSWDEMATHLHKLFVKKLNQEGLRRILVDRKGNLVEPKETAPLDQPPTTTPTTTALITLESTTELSTAYGRNSRISYALRQKIEEAKLDQDRAAEKRRKRFEMMLVGCAAMCTMMVAFAIRTNCFTQSDAAEKRRNEDIADNNTNTAKYKYSLTEQMAIQKLKKKSF